MWAGVTVPALNCSRQRHQILHVTKTKFTWGTILMLKWTPLPIFKRIIGELKWNLTTSFSPFLCLRSRGRLPGPRASHHCYLVQSLPQGCELHRCPSAPLGSLGLQWCQTAQAILSSGKTRAEMGMVLSLSFELSVPT